MSIVNVKISPTVTDTQRADPRFISLLRQCEVFFNSESFTPQFRRNLSLHEAGHILYARRYGATNIQFHGPTMYWDCRPEYGYDCPAISRSAVFFTTPTKGEAKDILKMHIGGFIFREVLSDEPNDNVAISMDVDGARRWHQSEIGGTEKEFQEVIAQARKEILADLKSEEFKKLVWDTAKEFADAVFPKPNVKRRITPPRVGRNDPCPCGAGKKFKRCCGVSIPAPNLTAASLRAKRLGWMYA